MTMKSSSKGQVVLPKQARLRLRLRPGVKLVCEVRGDPKGTRKRCECRQDMLNSSSIPAAS